MHALAFINNIGSGELLLIAMIGLLLFGKKLPEVGRSLGKTMIEFKKGLQGIEEDIERATREPSRPTLSEPSSSVPAIPATPESQQSAEYPHSVPTATTYEATSPETVAAQEASASVPAHEPTPAPNSETAPANPK